MRTFQLGNFTRSTEDEQEVANLLRKGWTEIPYVDPESGPAPVPPAVPLWAFHYAIAQIGKTQAVTDLIASLPEPPRVKANIQLQYKDPIVRDSPLLDQLGAMLNPPMTSADIDDVFRLAASLQ